MQRRGRLSDGPRAPRHRRIAPDTEVAVRGHGRRDERQPRHPARRAIPCAATALGSGVPAEGLQPARLRRAGDVVRERHPRTRPPTRPEAEPRPSGRYLPTSACCVWRATPRRDPGHEPSSRPAASQAVITRSPRCTRNGRAGRALSPRDDRISADGDDRFGHRLRVGARPATADDRARPDGDAGRARRRGGAGPRPERRARAQTAFSGREPGRQCSARSAGDRGEPQ